MPLTTAEAIVLRGSSLAESDLITTLLTKEFGKIRAVAKSARRLKSKFSGVLEPLSYVRIDYYERENRELVYLNRCDLEETFFDLQSDYGFQVACAYMIEVLDALLQDREANPKVFRLILSLLRARKRGVETTQLLPYFNYWMLKLCGFLPALVSCVHCGTSLRSHGGRLIFSQNKIYCEGCRSSGGSRLTPDCIALAEAFARDAVQQIHERGAFRIEAFERLNPVLERLLVTIVERPLKSIDLLHDLRRGERRSSHRPWEGTRLSS